MGIFVQYHNLEREGNLPELYEEEYGIYTYKKSVERARKGAQVYLIVGLGRNPRRYFARPVSGSAWPEKVQGGSAERIRSALCDFWIRGCGSPGSCAHPTLRWVAYEQAEQRSVVAR